MEQKINHSRCHRLIKQAIGAFALDLRGLNVLTEAATGYYIFTPLIAALAGAERVFALTRDSAYGTAAEVADATASLAGRWSIKDRIEILESRTDRRISEADVVTNLGYVRPLDADILSRLKPTAAIPLMWETWEYRPEDLDLAECHRLGIPILGTDESYPALATLKYVGLLAVRLLWEAGIEVFRSRIAILGGDPFGLHAEMALRQVGAETIRIHSGAEGRPSLRAAIKDADALIVVEHQDRAELLSGAHDGLNAADLSAMNPGLCVVHICGNVDRQALTDAGLVCWPRKFAGPGYMSVTTAYLGPKPLIDLHSAGLKVGAELTRARLAGVSRQQAERDVCAAIPFAQMFGDVVLSTEALTL